MPDAPDTHPSEGFAGVPLRRSVGTPAKSRDPHTCKWISVAPVGILRYYVRAVQPSGLRDAIAVLLGRYDARIWVKATEEREQAEQNARRLLG